MISKLFTIRRSEWPAALLFLVALVALQAILFVRYWPIFAHFTDDSWTQFIRNFRMSGFDPIAYSILSDWHVGYDLLRHPLLPFLLYPLSLLNRLLWWLTGANCAQLLMAALLTFSAFWAMMFHRRTLREVVGAGRWASTLLTALLLGFGMVAVTTMVPDHFCFSLMLLLLTVYRAGTKMKSGGQFSRSETLLLLVATSGVTLSNGVVVLMAVALVNGRRFFRPRFLLSTVVLPLLLLVGFAEGAVVAMSVGNAIPELPSPTHSLSERCSENMPVGNASERCGEAILSQSVDAVAGSVNGQFAYTGERASRTDILIENFFGESLQLHRKYILGDVLLKRPVIIRYTWPVQYVVEAMLLLFAAAGFCAGLKTHPQKTYPQKTRPHPLPMREGSGMFSNREVTTPLPQREVTTPLPHREGLGVGLLGVGLLGQGLLHHFVWLLAGILAFNLLLHVGVGFGINEVHIMAAHWAFVLTLSMGFLFTRKRSFLSIFSLSLNNPSSGFFLFAITVYLWVYHGYQLAHYLSWPLIK